MSSSRAVASCHPSVLSLSHLTKKNGPCPTWAELPVLWLEWALKLAVWGARHRSEVVCERRDRKAVGTCADRPVTCQGKAPQRRRPAEPVLNERRGGNWIMTSRGETEVSAQMI